MTIHLDWRMEDFDARFANLIKSKRENAPDVENAVSGIVADVRERGDAALIDYTEQFDKMRLVPETLKFSSDEIDELSQKAPSHEREALKLAADRICAYHQRQIPQNQIWEDESGAILGWKWTSVKAAGLYVPGGLASYPSSVLMNAIPAKVAGVQRIVISVPTPNGAINPLVLMAAKLAGVEEIYRIGGAQAIAAMAFGTETIAPVDKITGPGNAYVAAAKRMVFGKVGIDMIAGPSEILIIADKDNDPDWLALDLLSQAEHDESAQAILITDSKVMASAVEAALERNLAMMERRQIAEASWRGYGAIILVEHMERAVELADKIAPEHLEICVADPKSLAEKIGNAGAIFLGAWTPEAICDYVGGPNHVLPTARSARFSSGLNVLDFMKRTTLAQMNPGALAAIGPAAETLAISESLEAHGLSVRARLNRLNDVMPDMRS
ncbi:MAG: histidinol dehydrogenase [Roseovarius sp.]|nr:histidinol dehydrogenase [Roseovarius sp.]MCY4315731.1 histidinol dehydrogenase [Roseovarius sp.]